jgi:hypothetical protein
MDSDTVQPMKTTSAQTTFAAVRDWTRPTTLECSGAELAGLLADMKARGCIVLGMASVCVSRWRLSLDWRNTEKSRFRSTGVQTG